MEKLFIKHYDEMCTVYFELDQYSSTGNLAVIMLTDDVIVDETFHYCTLEVGALLQPEYAYVDDNIVPGLIDWLEENRLGYRIDGCVCFRSFSAYQLFKFDMDELLKYTKYDRRKHS